MKPKKALIGMSGGVDSSVAALAVAQKLGIPLTILPFLPQFSQSVIEDFVRCYESGLTPNPCIRCNARLKFGAMLDWALEQGFDYVVSGHYAQILRDPDTGRYFLRKALDRSKDQTYFLACLDQRQLAHIRFPLGQLTKAQVRQIAGEQGFLTAR